MRLSQAPIFWVIVSLSLVISPHISRFPGWSILLIFLLLVWRLLSINHHIWLAPKWLIFLIGISSFAGVFVYFGTVFGASAGSVILSILLTLKLHESVSHRDYMLLMALSFFIIVTNFLFSQSIPTLIYMLFAIVILIISMISINQDSAPISFKFKLKFATKILFQAIPLMLILFVFFPRISGPLWKLPTEKQTSQTGLSDTMSPGNISELIKSNAIAFRVKFDSSIPAQNKLYWRALVLWYFDGNTWEKGKHNFSPVPTFYSPDNSSVNYTVTMQAHQKNWLYALDIPSSTPNSIIYTNNYTLQSRNKITHLYQYKTSSILKYYSTTSISPWEKSAGLNIPLNTNPRTIQMGKALTNQYDTNEQIINHVLNLFNRDNFHYTLRPPLTPGFNSVDQFLFTTKRGFCEHYSSSFTLLMRAAGIPARVVVGFQGGTINPINNVVSVRNSDAHAWSEVWLNKKGWVRIDPTAAIAPQRVENNLDSALADDEFRPFYMQINFGIIKDALLYWDAIDNQWNQWIVGYDKDFQQRFLEMLLNKKTDLSDKILFMIISITVMALIIMAFIFKPRRKIETDLVIKLYNKFCDKLATKGLTRQLHEGPLDYAKRATETFPASRDSITLITRLYTKVRYETSHTEKQLSQLKYHIGKLNLDTKAKPEKKLHQADV